MISMAVNKKTRHRIALLLFGAYLILLFYFLFFSEAMGRSGTDAEYHYNLTPFQEIKRFWIYRKQLGHFAVVSNLLGNVVGFIPFGFMLPCISRRTRGFLLITLSGFNLSLCVECIQLVSRVGSFDVDDMILNTLGTALGYVVFAVFHSYIDKKARRKK